MRILTGDDDIGPMKARSDLVDLLRMNPENTEAIVKLIQSELPAVRDADVISQVSEAIDEVASGSDVSSDTKDNVLFWLTNTSSDVRQMIMVRTIEELLRIESCRAPTIEALTKVSSKENVDMVMEWINRKILTLNQGIFVLLFPDSSPTV